MVPKRSQAQKINVVSGYIEENTTTNEPIPDDSTGKRYHKKPQDYQKFDELSKTISKLASDISDLEKRQSTIFNAKIEKEIDKLSDKEFRIYEALGVFFGLFTFISINVQLFTRITDIFTAVLFSAILFCLLCLMLILFNYLLMYKVFSKNEKEEEKFRKLHLGLAALFIILTIGVLCVFYANKGVVNPIQGTSEFNEAVDSRIREKIEPFYYDKDKVDNILKERNSSVSKEIQKE